MRFSTAYNHRERIISHLSDLYSGARIFGMLSSDISKRRNEIMATLPKGAPGWITEYATGWERCMRSFMEREVIFCYTVDGKLYSTWRDRDDYYEKHGLGPKEVYDRATHSGHYWDCKGELRPYYVTEIERDEHGNEIHKIFCRICSTDTPIKTAVPRDEGGYVGECCLPTNA